MAPTTAASSFGGLVTPVNVLNLQIALSNHPNREFVNKLCLELMEGARIGYSGPRHFRFSKNSPTASLNPEVVTSNLDPARAPIPYWYFKFCIPGDSPGTPFSTTHDCPHKRR